MGGREHIDSCLQIGRSLPEHFNSNSLKEMKHSLLEDTLYVAVEKEEVTGFLIVRNKGKEVVEISWLAVDPARQGGGVGRALVGRIEEDLTVQGVRMLMVKTLAEEANYPPFEATRRFYERAGFLRLETIDPYPGWDGDPAVIYAKALR